MRKDTLNTIIVTGQPRGPMIGCIVTGTPKPGTLMQIDVSEAEQNGRRHWEAYAPGTDGYTAGATAVLLEDRYQGKTKDDAYSDGDFGLIYFPQPGEELLMLVKNETGTADSYAVGALMIGDSGTGKLVPDAGTPHQKPFQLLEASGTLTADTLVHCMFTGH